MALTKITNKQQHILTLIYRFRFLNRIQIQTLLKHKYHKRIIDWLKDLTEKEYLERIYSTKYGEINKPAIYYLSINGIRYLRDQNYSGKQLDLLYHEKEKSEALVSKHILIADICLDLQSKNSNKMKFGAATASDLSDPDYKYNFLTELGLDLVLVKEEKGAKKYYFLEIFEPTLPQHSIRKRIRNYIDFYYSNEWDEHTDKKFPIILLVCPDLPVLINVKRFTKKLINDEYEDMDLKFQLTTEQKIKEVGFDSDIWETV